MQEYGPLIGLGLFLAGLSALIVARVSARRLVPVMLLWLLGPAILMAGVLLLGNLFSPAQGSAGSNAIFGVMLIGTIVLVPWLAICELGMAVGFVLRRKWPPAEPPRPATAHAEPEPAPRPAAPFIAPTLAAPSQRILAVDAPDAHFSHPSPDGSIRIDIEPVEWASGQWVHTPRVVETASRRVLCDLLGSDWQADTAFPRERYVWLGLRRYRSPGHLFVEFDLDADRYRIALDALEEPDEEGPLGDVSDRLEQWWQSATALAMARAPAQPPPPPKPHPFAAWRTALVILIGAIVAIAALVWFSMETGVRAPHVPILRPGAYGPR